MSAIENRYDFILLFDVKDGNPNGDPDAGNLPRIDPETSQGLVTDVCLKRKIRNYIALTRPGQEGHDIYVKERAILAAVQAEIYKKNNLAIPSDAQDKAAPSEAETGGTGKKAAKGSSKKSSDFTVQEQARAEMCKAFYDVRAFGAVMSIGQAKAGQVRGPVQLTFSRSLDPIVTLEHAITRVAVATQKEADNQSGENRTMGRKNTIPYGLYRGFGFVSPALAKQTGFHSADLELLWESLLNMFEHDRSASRGLMTLRKLIVFRHASALGNASAQTLFDTVRVTRKDAQHPPRDFSDYTVEAGAVPKGVERLELQK